MIQLLALFISLVATSIAARNWRWGILAMVFVGMLTDPFRKLTPGFPGYYIIWTGALFGIIWLIATSRNQIVRLRWLALGDQRVRTLGRWLLGLIILHSVHSLVRWGNPLIPVLGLVFYLAPVIALAVGWSYSRNLEDVRRFLYWYGGLAATFASTVYLSSSYEGAWPVLSEIGLLQGGKQLMIYDVGTILASYSGLFRVGEIAAWHAATAAIFLAIVAFDKPSVPFRLVVAVVVVAMVGVIILTGRRKMLMALTIFIAFQWALLAMLHRMNNKLVTAGLLLGVAVSVMLSFMREGSESSLYLERGGTVFEGVDERLEMANNLLISAFYRGEGIGLGVGVTSQGMVHIGENVGLVGGSSEAGVGKIMVELGVLGFVLLIALLVMYARRIWMLLKVTAKVGSRPVFYAVSLLSFLIANIATFTVATQLYSDPFVLIVLGLAGGMMLGMIRDALRVQLAQQEAQRA